MNSSYPNILVLGSGRLARAFSCNFPVTNLSRKSNNLYLYKNINKNHIAVVNCIGSYSSLKAPCIEANFRLVIDLVSICNKKGLTLVQFTPDTIYTNYTNYTNYKKYPTEEDCPAPHNDWWTYSKALADEYIQTMANKYLIFRCAFKEYHVPAIRQDYVVADNFRNYIDTFDLAELALSYVFAGKSGVYNVGVPQSEKQIYTNYKNNPTKDISVSDKSRWEPTYLPLGTIHD